jgi:alkanesulfonate monooxygenase SsuD/methylene tetrahydromethanopterin reductase-like flavin-dependent oxidoreductase (luciferase family)
MHSWLEVDDAGRQVLARRGTGIVTAIVPLGDASTAATLVRVEIQCDAPVGSPRAIKYSVHPLLASDDDLLAVAHRALDSASVVEWTVEWHRHDWIPSDLPVSSLNLTSDARARLAGLEPVEVPDSILTGSRDRLS